MATGVLLDGVSVLNNDYAGIVVNGSIVTINNIATSGNGWGGINVDQGSGVTTIAKLIISGHSTHGESTQIWIDDNTNSQISVDDTSPKQYDSTKVGIVTIYTLKTSSTGNASASLSQYANDAPTGWVNGNLGASKATYYEGDSIPYRMVMDNLSLASHSLTIEWDTTKSSKHAEDFLTTFDRSVPSANPCVGVSGCSSFSTFAIPKDPQVDNGSGSPIIQIPGDFRLYGGNITGVSAYSYDDGVGFVGDKSARITVTFTASVSNPVLAWGGHIAHRQNWGADNSAIAIPGSPYHMRLIDLDGSGGNQDRSLSADAVIFPASITIIKQATPEGSTSFPFTASPTPLADFSLVDNGTSANTKLFPDITNFQTYTVTENTPSGWALDGVVCDVTSPNGGSQSVNGATATIDLEEGEDVTCTYTNSQVTGSITIVKDSVPNDAQNFSFSGDLDAFSLDDDSDITLPNTQTFSGLLSGTYTVTEGLQPGWNLTALVCNDIDAGTTVDLATRTATIDLDLNQDITCTFTNTKLGKIIVEKQTLPNLSGQSFNFTASYDADGFSLTDGGQDDSGFLMPGAYSVSETVPAGWNLTNTSCTSSIADSETAGSLELDAGETITCVFTNTQKGHIVVNKVTNPGGSLQSFAFTAGGAGYSNFNLTDAATPNDQEVVPGSYSVTEGALGGWDLDSATCDQGETPGNLDVEPGETVTCTFTNTQRGNISGYKYDDANGDGINTGDWTPVTGWVIELWKDGVFTQQTATTNGSGFYSFTNLIQGAYQLIEQVLGGWAKVLPISGTINVTLDAGENDIGNNFVNTQYGTIVIEKQTFPNGSLQVFDFDMNFGDGDADLSDGQQDTTNNLLPGPYSITETPEAGWSLTNTVCTSSLGHTESASALALNSGETITCVFTNTQLPKLTVTKTVINHGLTYDTSHFAPYQVDTTTVTLGQANIFSIGPHTVTEVEDLNYNATFGGACDASGNVTLAAGDDLTCTIINEEVSTSLTLVKTVTNNNGGGALPTDWTLSASGPTNISGESGDASITNASVNSGVYTLSESVGPANYTAGSWSCLGGSLIGDQLTLLSGQSATCTINNNDNAPKLRLVKSVTNDNGGTSVATNWTLTATGTGQSPSNLSGQGSVNSGVNFKADTYTLGESGPVGYSPSSWDCEGATMTDANHVVVPFGGDETCRINNNDNAPSLTLVKTVTNDDGGDALPSDWTLTAAGPTGFSGAGPTVNNGASFDAGTYTLSESGLIGYSAGDWSCVKNAGNPITGSSISLALGDTATCTIVNDDIAPKLTLVKTVVNDNGGGKVVSNFSLFISGVPATSGVSYDQTANLELTASETSQTGYTPSVWGGDCAANGTITLLPGDDKTCTITNDDQPGTLIVKKIISGGEAVFGDFSFQIGQDNPVPFEGDGQNDLTVDAGTYTITEPKFDSYEASYDNCTRVQVANGETETCTITNTWQNPKVTIIKSNDKSGGTTSGSTVTYTLNVKNEGNIPLSNFVVTDILPGGFSYVAGSTSGVTSADPSISGSVLSWNISDTLSVGEDFTISYRATIASDLGNGMYINYATCRALIGSFNPEFSIAVQEEEEISEINCNTANSTVTIGSTLGYSGSLGGQVLGASTILPATGSPTWVLVAALAALGTGLYLNSYAGRVSKKKNAKK